MTAQSGEFRSVILAGERPGGSALTHTLGISASVMAPVAGKPALARVIKAVNESRLAHGGIICGPAAEAIEQDQALTGLLNDPHHQWLAPAAGPAASALSALQALDHHPALLTAGDHALLSGDLVDEFCQQALTLESDFDFVIGLVPYQLVEAAWPESRRTVLRFSDGGFCGSNLFAVLTPAGRKALSFWQQADTDRKHPWRIARRLGFVALLRYLFRRTPLEEALKTLSVAAGCRIGYVKVEHARAAVDVDTVEDQQLAERILASRN